MLVRVALLAGCLASSSAFLSPVGLPTAARLPSRAALPASRVNFRAARAAPTMMTVLTGSNFSP